MKGFFPWWSDDAAGLGAATAELSPPTAADGGVRVFDLAQQGLRALNRALHEAKGSPTNATVWEIVHTRGAHAIAVGVDAPLDITVRGTTGYYCAGMNKQATIRIDGSAGQES